MTKAELLAFLPIVTRKLEAANILKKDWSAFIKVI